MPESITIDIGAAYPFVEQRVLQFFGKDAATQEEKDWLRSLHGTAIEVASKMQCVGMSTPVLFDDIYQITKLYRKPRRTASETFTYTGRAQRAMLVGEANTFKEIGLEPFLSEREDAIILAGPGWGKSTLMSALFRKLLTDTDAYPALFLLRRPNAVSDLQRFVGLAEKIQKKSQASRLVVLVDGYDELTLADRRSVSDLLLQYQALRVGNFYLTCREYYQVLQLSAPEVRLGGFSIQDKYRFVTAFLKAFESPLDPIEVVNYFHECGFSDLLSHPLLLTLACIVQTSSQNVNPRSGMKLLSRALTVLTYRWDEQKGIRREEATSIDGEDRVQILRKIAHGAKSAFVPDLRAISTTKQELLRLAYEHADPRCVLDETAKFYGILTPTDGGWEFVHRTLQDFLAAQQAVSTGQFAKKTHFEWDARTAYAACLSDDSTNVLLTALQSPQGLPTAAEILDNTSRYDVKTVSEGLRDYFHRPRNSIVYHVDTHGITGQLSSDFIRFSSTRLLNRMIEDCAQSRDTTNDLIVGYCAFELAQRNVPADFQAYSEVLKAFGHSTYTFRLRDVGQIQLEEIDPNRKLS
jgi:hypothetical protein